MACKLALLLSVELFVLIAAIFLLVYISKQGVSKWFTYGTVAIIITVLMLMICSVCCAMCGAKCGPERMQKECRFEEEGCNKRMMFKMCAAACQDEMRMTEGKCCKEEEEEECEMKKEDCCKGKDRKVIKEVVIDSLPKKEIIKK